MDVSFDDIYKVGVAIVVGLTTTIGVMAKYILGRFAYLEKKLDNCEVKHDQNAEQLNAVTSEAAELRGRVTEMEKIDPAAIATAVVKAVMAAIPRVP